MLPIENYYEDDHLTRFLQNQKSANKPERHHVEPPLPLPPRAAEQRANQSRSRPM